MARSLAAALLVALLTTAVAAQRPRTITTDGTNPDSPVKITEVNLASTSRGQGLEWVVSDPRDTYGMMVRIENSSKSKALESVTLYVRLETAAGFDAKQFVEKVGTLEPGQAYEFDSGGFFVYGYQWANLYPKVFVEHDRLDGEDPPKEGDEGKE